MSLQLGRREDVETVTKCIETGFASVIMDGSHLPFEENVAVTDSSSN